MWTNELFARSNEPDKFDGYKKKLNTSLLRQRTNSTRKKKQRKKNRTPYEDKQKYWNFSFAIKKPIWLLLRFARKEKEKTKTHIVID